MPFDSQAFGRRLAAARAWRGLEPKQVAQHLGLSSEAVNRWERGGLRRPPARGQIRLLAEVLEQSEEWLLAGNDPPWGEDGTSEPELEGVLRAIDELPQRIVDAFSRPEFRRVLREALAESARADTAGRRRQLERDEPA